MKFFENLGKNFKKGMDNAKKDIEAGQNTSERITFADIKEKILDTTVDDGTVAVALKKFLATSLNGKENDEAVDLFILNRPDARDALLNK